MHSFSTQSEPNAITITGEILLIKRENEVKKGHVPFILLCKVKETNLQIIVWLVVYFPFFLIKKTRSSV